MKVRTKKLRNVLKSHVRVTCQIYLGEILMCGQAVLRTGGRELSLVMD